MVLGDLTFDEAYDFYLHCLEEIYGSEIDGNLFSTSKEDFQKVFYMTGGRMFFIETFIQQISETGQKINEGNTYISKNLLVLDFEPILQEHDMLSDFVYGTDTFTGKDFQYAVGSLINSKTGYYSYEGLYLELGDGNTDAGKKKVSALIKKNVLHFRPASKMARDLIPYPPYRVVTATGTPALRAMELILKKHGK